MKNSKTIVYLMLVALSFLFIQCTSEYTAIPGPAGLAGINGLDGTDGIAGTDAEATCVACHSNTHREPINGSFDLSKHGTGTAFGYAGSRGGDDPTNRCAQCHGEQGYLDYINLGEANEDGYENPSPISCTTCHDQHSTFDFENDGFDFALRTFDPVTLVLDPTYTIDFGNTSNNCITCHQPRSSYPVPADDGTGLYEITSDRFGPHHGPQSTMLEGILGANVPGAEGYPGIAQHPHRKFSSCTQCHMAPSDNIEEGLHSWNINIATSNACTTCHPDGANDQLEGFDTDIATLKQKLYDIGILTDLNGDPNRSVLGEYSVKQAQAAWNYMTLIEDRSKGVHNPDYTKALLQNSIEALEGTK